MKVCSSNARCSRPNPFCGVEARKGDSETTSGCSDRSPGCIVDRGGFVVWKRRCRVSEGERGVADVGISSALRAVSFFDESEVSNKY
jgi:hypothetical protein